jgi:hypothetical protein
MNPLPVFLAWRRGLLCFACAASVAVLAACGGGITIGFGSGSAFDNSPPSVSIAASSGTAVPGQLLTLVAAAADESGVDTVIFFRFDGGVATALGSLGRPPYELSTVVPADGRTNYAVFARAIDNAGNRADSAALVLPISR